MEIKKWKYYNVKANGELLEGGSVDILFTVKISSESSCNIESCTCRKCEWISINLGIQMDGAVYGLTHYFSNQKERLNFIALN